VFSGGAAYIEKPCGTGAKNIKGSDDVQTSGRRVREFGQKYLGVGPGGAPVGIGAFVYRFIDLDCIGLGREIKPCVQGTNEVSNLGRGVGSLVLQRE
jgi:hypothetical protein